jgi:chorismate mutase
MQTFVPPLDKPLPATETPDSLGGVRAEIDRIDDAVLDLLQRRMALAATIGSLKTSGQVDALKLRPDREAAVISRLLRHADPANRRLALGVWREIMAAGLARQGALEVLVWGGSDPALVLDAARRRFGSSPTYRVVQTPAEALSAAATNNVIGVLALDSSSAWWTRLAAQYRDLWVFESIDAIPGSSTPQALAVARIDPEALAGGRTFVISAGGDAGGGERARRLLGMEEGWRFYAVDREAGEISAMDRYRGVIGRAPVFSLSEDELAKPDAASDVLT